MASRTHTTAAQMRSAVFATMLVFTHDFARAQDASTQAQEAEDPNRSLTVPAASATESGGQDTPQETEATAPATPDDARVRQCTAQDVLRGLCSAEEAAASSADKFWSVMGRIDYRQPIVVDRDPENDLILDYYLGAEFALPFLTGLYTSAWIGMTQRFWTVEGESAVDFIDPFLAVGYRHSVALRGVGLPDHAINFVHRLAAYFPASRESRSNLYYTALDWITATRFAVGYGFLVGVDLRAQYRFHEFAEQNASSLYDGYEYAGGMNTRLRLEAGLLLQQTCFDDVTFGSLLVQGSAGIRGRLRYPSSENYVAATSDQELWQPDYYWTLGLTYTPIEYVSLTASLEHGYSDLIRGGIAQTFGVDRDETKLVFSVFGRY